MFILCVMAAIPRRMYNFTGVPPFLAFRFFFFYLYFFGKETTRKGRREYIGNRG